MTMNRSPARMRLPEGFSHLRPDLGKILKDHRTGVSGTVGPVSQEALAASVGMTLAALSRIENGHTWPQAQTLDRILEALEMDWPDVAVRGVRSVPPRRFDGTPQGTQVFVLCQRLRAERRALGWSLVELSRRSGVSASHLSRIERAEAGQSAVFTWHHDDLGRPREDRRVVFSNRVLADLATGRLREDEEE
ncbi:transcriptional regulator with XRE-family HTH domain [Sphingomonas sp. BE138]|nr:transcriptional regulator with XRE-family HTH domain [Sphingomonas sp. BE138]